MLTRNLAVFTGSTLLLALAACSSAPTVDESQYPAPKKDTAATDTSTPGAFDNADPTNTPASIPADTLSACATATAAAAPTPVYLVIAYDQSGSMSANNKWDNAKAAMKTFFQSNESVGIHASMTFFPIFNDQFCAATQYAAPQVSMTALPSTAFGSALDLTSWDAARRGTPTVAALSGMMSYAKSIQNTTAKDGKLAVVMVTDGIPEKCSDAGDIDQSVAVAAMNAAQIPTYVVGVGDQLADLNDLAAGGGTGSAFIVSPDASKTQAQLTAAFNSIKQSALACDYKIPAAPQGQTFDRNKVNVQYTPPGASATALDYNPSCTGGKGWKYDDANNPTRVLACDSTCDTLKATAGKVDLVFGCATRTTSVN